jgi:hypothetical protein
LQSFRPVSLVVVGAMFGCLRESRADPIARPDSTNVEFVLVAPKTKVLPFHPIRIQAVLRNASDGRVGPLTAPYTFTSPAIGPHGQLTRRKCGDAILWNDISRLLKNHVFLWTGELYCRILISKLFGRGPGRSSCGARFRVSRRRCSRFASTT